MRILYLIALILGASVLDSPRMSGQSPVSPDSVKARRQQDVVFLKGGGVMHGRIIERSAGESVLFRTRDGDVFRYQLSQVDSLTAEPAPPPPGLKSPLSAALWSAFLPGGGQAYNGEWLKAAGFALVISFAESQRTAGGTTRNGWALLEYSTIIGSIVDAPLSALRLNRRKWNAVTLEVGPHPVALSPSPVSASPTAGRERVARGAKLGLSLGTLRF